MGLGDILKRVAPAVITYATGGTASAIFAATAASETARIKADRQNKQIAEQNRRIEEENRRMSEIFGTGNYSSVQPMTQGQATSNAGFGSGFGTFLGDVGRNIISPISSIAGQVLPFFGSRDTARQPATTRSPILQGTELQTTGQNQAFVGGLPNIIGQAGRFLRSPIGQIGIGTGVGSALGMFDGAPRSARVTRKTKRLAQQAYSLAFGDLSTATQIFAQLSGLSVNEQQFVLILTKRFRNDGAVVTKAALRKTKSTIRRLKGMCDMYDSLRKAPVRRRTTMKRATGTTLISNK